MKANCPSWETVRGLMLIALTSGELPALTHEFISGVYTFQKDQEYLTDKQVRAILRTLKDHGFLTDQERERLLSLSLHKEIQFPAAI